MKETNSIYQRNRESPHSHQWNKARLNLHSERNASLSRKHYQTSLRSPVAPHAKPPPESVPFLHWLPGLPWNKIPVLNILSINFLPTTSKTSFISFQRIWWDSWMQKRNSGCLFQVHAEGGAQLPWECSSGCMCLTIHGGEQKLLLVCQAAVTQTYGAHIPAHYLRGPAKVNIFNIKNPPIWLRQLLVLLQPIQILASPQRSPQWGLNSGSGLCNGKIGSCWRTWNCIPLSLNFWFISDNTNL